MTKATAKIRTAIAAFTLAGCLAIGGAALAQTPPAGKPGGKQPSKAEMEKAKKMQEDFMADLQERLKHRFTPVVKKVTVGAAKVGKPIAISVQAAYDNKRAIDKIDEVKVFYSSDGGKKWGKPIKLKKSGSDWKGNLPKPAAKGVITYYIRIQDNRGNVFSDLPCKVTTWPPLDDSCMVKGAADIDPVDDPASKIENNLDIWEFKVGMDDNYFYFQQSVEGSIKKGTLSPTHINSYIALAVDSQMIKEVDDIMSLVSDPEAAKKKFKGKENLFKPMMYSPLMKSIMPEAKECFTIKMPSGGEKPKEGQQPNPAQFMDTKNLSCSAKGPDLFFRLNKASLQASMKKDISLIGAITMTMNEQSMTGIKFGDMLNVTRVLWNPRTIKVN